MLQPNTAKPGYYWSFIKYLRVRKTHRTNESRRSIEGTHGNEYSSNRLITYIIQPSSKYHPLKGTPLSPSL
jgi:hypothetical protein